MKNNEQTSKNQVNNTILQAQGQEEESIVSQRSDPLRRKYETYNKRMEQTTFGGSFS
jgi:hypothetical protein